MKITVKRTIDAPADAAWRLIGDFSNVHQIHPFLTSSHFVDNSSTCEVGSTRQCNFKDGSVLKEQITEWKEGSYYTIRITASTGPIKDGFGTVGVTPIDHSKSEVYMILDVTPPNRIAQPMMFLMFRYKVIPAILKKLETLAVSQHQQELIAA